MPDRLDPDLAELLGSCVVALDTAVSVADALDPELPLVYVNPAFERLTGYPSEQAVGRNARFMQGDATDAVVVRTMGASLRRGESTRARLVNYRADGSPFWVDLHISPVRDDAGRVVRFAAVQHDVTAEVRAQEAAVRAATRDPLTGLMNRVAFGDALERELARARRARGVVGVLYLDLDDFKAVNDTHGHPVGDAYLLHVAACLGRRLRGQDVAARVGGDEFAALLADLTGDGTGSAAQVAADLRAALSGPFTVDGAEHRTTVSVGVSLFPRDGSTVRELIAAADDDMYAHKPPRGRRGER